MQIRDMTPGEVAELLDRVHLGRLACVRDGHPHIAPLFFVHEKDSLFAFSTLGRKVTWMRENPLVCVEFEEVQSTRSWKVVLVEGRYEEVSDASDPLQTRAFDLLQKRPMWWEPGYVRTLAPGGERELMPVYFRIVITNVSGRCGFGDD